LTQCAIQIKLEKILFIASFQGLYIVTQILHLREKPGFLRMANGKNLNFSLRNPVFLVLLRMVHSGQLINVKLYKSGLTQAKIVIATETKCREAIPEFREITSYRK
jgi:hypothetical protein